MQVDWITVAAQVANFLVLLWLLNRFLYRPVIEAMDRREAAIAARMAAAEEREREAGTAERDYRAKMEEVEASRRRLIEEAEAAAESERSRLVAEAREEVAEERRLWLQGVGADRADFIAALNETAATEIGAIARDVLADLAHADIEPQLVEVFIDRLDALGPDERRELAEAAVEAGGGITVRTSARLAAPLRDRLRASLRGVFGEDMRIRFVEQPDSGLGIEAAAGSRVLAWSVDSYLDRLESRLAEEIEELVPERRDG